MFTLIFVQPLFNILFALYALLPGHDFGIAVIVLTIIVRLVLWPLVSKQLHSQKAMQKLQPEIARVRKEAGGDKQKETQQLMELYKEKGVSPFSSLLPILLQFPILIALVHVFNNSLHTDKITELGYGFVEQLGIIPGIIHHQTQFSPTLFGVLDLTKPFWGLAVAAGIAQYLQARQLQPDKSQMDDQQRIMSYMTMVFPVVTIIFALNFPSALSLYWTVTSLMAVLQQYLVLRQDAEEMEEVVVAQERSVAPAAPAKPKRKKTGKGRARKGAAK